MRYRIAQVFRAWREICRTVCGGTGLFSSILEETASPAPERGLDSRILTARPAATFSIRARFPMDYLAQEVHFCSGDSGSPSPGQAPAPDCRARCGATDRFSRRLSSGEALRGFRSQGGRWHFAAPVQNLRILARKFLHYNGNPQKPAIKDAHRRNLAPASATRRVVFACGTSAQESRRFALAADARWLGRRLPIAPL